MTRNYLALGLAALLAACAGDEGVRRLEAPGDGPDEFAVMPVRPLVLPATNALPVPTPGGANLADPNPLGDAVAVLGGNPRGLQPGGIPSADAALVAAVSRNGVTPDVRALVAQEDADWRSRAGLTAGGGLFGGDPYWRVYARQALDAYGELDRFRAAGIRVPTAPPETAD